jgi:hypothetical protein
VANQALAWGNSTWLMASSRAASTHLDLLSNALVPTGQPIPLTGTWGYPAYVDTELDFDGTNYLALVSGSGVGFRGLRVNELGTSLDVTQLVLPAADAGVLNTPQLASSRTGRWLLAYRKADGHAYARTFSTCP